MSFERERAREREKEKRERNQSILWVAVSGVEEKSNINRNQISYYTPPWLSLYSLLGETMNFIIRTVKNTDRKSQRKKKKKKKTFILFVEMDVYL